MTTMDGRSSNYQPGKEVPNKEPPTNKFVVEMLYKVHRKRIQNIAGVVDCHIHIPDFLSDSSWKKLGNLAQNTRIAKENEELYGRIAKREAGESDLTRDARLHNLRITEIKSHSKRIKESGRIRKVQQIRKENELMLQHIERARPEYTLKSIKEWYKHHEHFKEGRRSDPTAGHIMKNMGELLPKRLPPVEKNNLDLAIDAQSARSGSQWSRNDDSSIGSISSFYSAYSNVTSSSSIDNLGIRGDENQRKIKKIKRRKEKKDKYEELKSIVTSSISPSSDNNSRRGTVVIQNLADRDFATFIPESQTKKIMTPGTKAKKLNDDEEVSYLSTKKLLISRTIAIPLFGSTGVLQIFCDLDVRNLSLEELETKNAKLFIRVMGGDSPRSVIVERTLQLDEATEIVKKSRSDISQAVEDADLLGLSELLVQMFNQADCDKSGALTFDEFQKLMEKIDLGISPQELRFVIVEADEDGNGVVDYNEFVPLAVDLIQAFKARNKGSIVYHAEDAILSQKVNDQMTLSDLNLAVSVCLEKIHEMDLSGTHNWKYPELRRALVQVAPKAHMSENEINLVCDAICKAGVNSRINEKTFFEQLKKARFKSLKNEYIIAEASPILKYLISEIMKIEEQDKQDSKIEKKSTGFVGVRQFQQVLHSLQSPLLSRLQVIIIMSEALENQGNIDYYQFAPQVSKTIEMMFDPKALKQRAELIEQKVLNSENLVVTNPEDLKTLLLALFKSNDIDRSQKLSIHEFSRILESLEFGLTDDEIHALFQDTHKNDKMEICFDDFFLFMKSNLKELEQKKHMKLLEKKSHIHSNKSGKVKKDTNKSVINYESSLKSVFRLEDKNSTGMIDYAVFEKLLRNLNLEITDFQVEVIMSELNMSSTGQIDYHDFIPICIDLLKTVEAKGLSDNELAEIENVAYDRADTIVSSCSVDINQIVTYLLTRFKVIGDTIEDEDARFETVQDVIKSPHSGLSRTESSTLLRSLFISNDKTKACNPSLSDKKSKHIVLDLKYILNASNTEQITKMTQIITDVRRLSIMRSLLNKDLNHNELFVALKSLLKKEAKDESVSRIINYNKFISANKVFNILEKTNLFNLQRHQILCIMSWAPCYDETHKFVNIHEFSEYASKIIGNILQGELLSVRSDMHINDDSIMKEISFESIEKYYRKSFEEVESEDGYVEMAKFIEIITNTPQVNLSERETAAILSQFEHNSHSVHWTEFIPWANNSLASIYREREFGKNFLKNSISRKSFMQSENNDVSFDTQRAIAARIADLIKIKSVGGNPNLVIAGDRDTKRSSLMTTSVENNDDSISDMVVLLKTTKIFNILNEKRDVIDRKGFLLRIVKVVSLESEPLIHVNIINIDSTYAKSECLKVRLSSHLAIDLDALKDFMCNLLEYMHIEVVNNVYSLVLHQD